MNEALEIHKLSDGSTIEIHADEYGDSPRTWDNLGTMVCFHKRYNLGDYKSHDYKSIDFDSWDALEAKIYEDHNVAVCFPLYLYDHSGITISASPFSCPWDSGQVGFIFISKEKVREEWGKKRISKQLLERMKACLLAEVDTYDQFIRGDVYGFIHKDANGEHIDSCWGFYGRDIEDNGMLDNFSPEIREEMKSGKTESQPAKTWWLQPTQTAQTT